MWYIVFGVHFGIAKRFSYWPATYDLHAREFASAIHASIFTGISTTTLSLLCFLEGNIVIEQKIFGYIAEKDQTYR
jgi:hypothetical protein